jgi:Rrf2 family iron-sulfur cluster assembly transcriptional regulator
MEISSRGQYAVMAVCDLSRASDDRPVSLAEIADRLGISVSYLEQLFANLRRAGLVRSVRGPGGGYFLAKPAADVSIADVFDAVAVPRAVDQAAAGTGPLWAAVGGMTRDYLGRVSIEQVSSGHVPRADVIVIPVDREARMAAD